MSPDFRLSGLAGALALALAAAAPMAASADEPVMATGQVGTKITLGPTNLTWNAENHFYKALLTLVGESAGEETLPANDGTLQCCLNGD